MPHDVPMCRQLIPPEEWTRHGGPVLGDRMEWSNRACGMAALRMILLTYGRPAPTVTELLHLGVKRQALTDRGWLHRGIADLATDHGVPGRVEPVEAGELTERLGRAPLIISVAEKFPVDGRRGGHLVIARGFDGDDILIRDPSAWGQTHDRIPLRRLAASYAGRAICFPPLTERTTTA